MRSLAGRYQWDSAWEMADAVIADQPDNPKAYEMVARVAHEKGLPKQAASMLIQACVADRYADEDRINRAVIACVGAGELFAAIETLSAAATAHPGHSETLRLLYDFQMGTEDRVRGLASGQSLVRQRKFDLELLMTLSNSGRRSLDSAPLDEVYERNPHDTRPLIGMARQQLDLGEFPKCVATFRKIIAQHPGFDPAHSLLCLALARWGKFDELKSHFKKVPTSTHAYPHYWLAVAAWAEQQRNFEWAVAAYREACQRDPSMTACWVGLHQAMLKHDPSLAETPTSISAAIQQRAATLSKFDQTRNRFDRSGQISREFAVELAGLLLELGKPWESEAWATIALTLPEDPAVDVAKTRQQIASTMTAETPWQIIENRPAFRFDELDHQLPTAELVAGLRSPGGEMPLNAAAAEPRSSSGGSAAPNLTEAAAKGLPTFVLANEASARGLDFFGRTSDTLHQPGIVLYQTLGCGGGTIDYDLDGWPDLYLIDAGGTPPARDSRPNQMFRNRNGQFAAALANTFSGDTGFGQGVTVGDINEDGLPDMLVLNYGPNRILINQGDGTFVDQTPLWLPHDDGEAWSTSGAIADLNGDGITDAMIVNYCAGLEPVTQLCDAGESGAAGSCSPVVFKAKPDQVLCGSGDGQLIDVTDAWGVKPEILGRGLGLVIGDFDGRPGVDAFVTNDMTNNHFWSFDLDGDHLMATESALPIGLAADERSLAQGSMGIATGDMDGDGTADFYVTNFSNEYNTMHSQSMSGIWQDQTSRIGLASETFDLVGFGTEAIDLDGDGDLEILVTNGHVDIFSRNGQRSLYQQPIELFTRSTGGVYASVAETVSEPYFKTAHVGRALWTVDVDRDRRSDIVITHQTEPVALLVNRTPAVQKSIQLKLVGTASSRDATGAVVTVRSGDQSQVSFVTSGSGYMCSNDQELRIPIAANTDCTVSVRWPDGSISEFPSPSAGDAYLVVQGHEGGFRTF